MSNKHTPGPWEMWTSCSFRRIGSQSGEVLCAVTQRSDGHPDLHFPNGGYEGPDAKLILAAPELLEALKDAAHRVRWLMQFTDDSREEIGRELFVWDSAIAKATS
jgi:hypothetical protein